MKKITALVLSLVLILMCFTACSGENTPQSDGGAPQMHEEDLTDVKADSFSKFSAADLEGNKVDESIFKGKKLTMINIWATFCGPCIREMPDLQTLSEKYADKDFQIIGIVCDVTRNQDGSYIESLYNSALDIVEQTGVKYVNLLPSESLDIIKLDRVYSVPETVFVDENGNIVGDSYIGSKSLESWELVVNGILAGL